jgi:hypothetical protein
MAYAAAHKLFKGKLDYRDRWERGAGQRNLLLRVELPQAVVDSIEAAEWPERIESEETLDAFPMP